MTRNSPRTLIVGAHGQLGQQFALAQNKQNFIFAGKTRLSVLDSELIRKFIKNNFIDVVINCSGYTNVPLAEEEPFLAMQLNGIGPENLGSVCAELGKTLIHISTDSVFDGNKNTPYSELDIPKPLNKYSATKLAGENAVLSSGLNKSSIVRVSWLYSNFGNNFYHKILPRCEAGEDLNVVSDQFSTPTFAGDLVDFVCDYLIEAEHSGCEIFHFSNLGKASWYEFAVEISKLKNSRSSVIPISTENYGDIVVRPKYTALSNTKIVERFNYKQKCWKQSLRKCIDERQTL